jgi:hypothetical protein
VTAEESAREQFVDWVRRHHGRAPEEVVRRPELDGGGFYGFTAVLRHGPVRALASPDRVLAYTDADAFAEWLAAVDFAHSPDADPVQLVHVYRSLQPPPEKPYGEDVFPLLYDAQIATAPTGQAAGAVEPPRLVPQGDGRRVDVWFQLEPGSRLELWSFRVAGDNTVTVQR